MIPFVGAWPSDRDLTLRESRERRAFTPEQWEAFADPNLFGHLLHVYQPDYALTVYEGRCSDPCRYELVSQSGNQFTLRFEADEDGETSERTFSVDGDSMTWPLRSGAVEIFCRISMTTALDRFPSLRERLPKDIDAA